MWLCGREKAQVKSGEEGGISKRNRDPDRTTVGSAWATFQLRCWEEIRNKLFRKTGKSREKS